MKLKFDITTQEYGIIRDILADYLPKGAQVWVFGSRAKHTARFNSDLDLALDAGREIDRRIIAELKDAFNDAPLSYAIDLVDIHQIEASFKTHIRGHAVEFPLEAKGHEPQLRFPGFEGEWERKRLGDVFLERKDRGNSEGTLLSVTLNHGVIKASDLERSVSASSDRSNYKSVKINDIAYNSMRMWQGASGKSDFNGIVSPAYTVVTPADAQNPTFWAYYFKLHRVIGLFERYSQGLTSDTWNLKYPAFSKIPLMAPKADEQKKIADFFAAIDAKIDLVSQQLDSAKTFKRGLLQLMFV